MTEEKTGAGQPVRKLSFEGNAERTSHYRGAMVVFQLMVLFPGGCTACKLEYPALTLNSHPQSWAQEGS